MKDKYPKVLIIGESFHLSSGGGITLSNLFKGWPKDKIAVITTQQNISKTDNSICELFYQFGKKENKKVFPFNYFQREIPSKIIKNPNKSQDKKRNLEKNVHNNNHWLYELLKKSNFLQLIDSYKVSNEIIDFIDNFSPDLIYTQLGSLSYTKFINNLFAKKGIPYVIHIMDDWIFHISNTGIAKRLVKKRISKEIDIVFRNSIGQFAISNSMAEEYERRYKKKFITFHNCIDYNFWGEFSDQPNKFESKKNFTMLYAGRIGLGTSTSLLLLANAISLINESNKAKIKFEIQTNDEHHFVVEALKKFTFTVFNKRVDYLKLPEKFSSVDILVLPIDFDEANISFIKYSIPTKVPEYMATGTPIILLAPKNTAIHKFFDNSDMALIISEKNINLIKEKIEFFLNSPNLRKSYANTAKQYSFEHFNCIKVRSKFRDYLNKLNEK